MKRYTAQKLAQTTRINLSNINIYKGFYRREGCSESPNQKVRVAIPSANPVLICWIHKHNTCGESIYSLSADFNSFALNCSPCPRPENSIF